MEYRDREGERQRESTNTDDWDEAQKKLRERLQARDDNTLPLLRKGEQITFTQWADHFLGSVFETAYPGPQDASSYSRVVKHLKVGFGEVLLVE